MRNKDLARVWQSAFRFWPGWIYDGMSNSILYYAPGTSNITDDPVLEISYKSCKDFHVLELFEYLQEECPKQEEILHQNYLRNQFTYDLEKFADYMEDYFEMVSNGYDVDGD
jgi:hypothetical protein